LIPPGTKNEKIKLYLFDSGVSQYSTSIKNSLYFTTSVRGNKKEFYTHGMKKWDTPYLFNQYGLWWLYDVSIVWQIFSRAKAIKIIILVQQSILLIDFKDNNFSFTK
jgi:hypothetical protein